MVQAATVPLALAAGDDPELSVVDLPGGDERRGLPQTVRQNLEAGAARLEQQVLDGAEAAIEDGYACNAGLPRCAGGRLTRMVVADERWDEAERRRLLREVLLPRWVARCGADCAQVWNQVAAALLDLRLEPWRDRRRLERPKA